MLERYLHTGDSERREGEGERGREREEVGIRCIHHVKAVSWSCGNACLLMHADIMTG